MPEQPRTVTAPLPLVLELVPQALDALTLAALDPAPTPAGAGRVAVRFELPEDLDDLPANCSYVQTVDERTNLRIEVRRASCGSRCRCDAAVRVVQRNGAVIPAEA